jgi:hypothetical protein
VLPASDGSPAVTAEARLVLPNGYQYQSVEASAALRVRLAAAEAADSRVNIAEPLDIFVAGGRRPCY